MTVASDYGLSQADLDSMTPAEREAFADHDDAADDAAALAAIAGEAEPEGKAAEVVAEKPAAKADDKPAEAAQPQAQAAPVAQPAAKAAEPVAQAAESAPAVSLPSTPSSYTVQVPADLAAREAAVAAARDEVETKWMANEITDAERVAELRRLDTEQRQIDKLITKAEIAGEMAQQNVAASWDQAVRIYAAHIKATEGIDYAGNRPLQGAFDAEVRALAADPANANQDAAFFVTKAHEAVKQAFGLVVKPQAPAGKPAAPNRAPDRSGIPPSLSSIPAAVEPSVAQDEFSRIRSLSGIEFEDALARMSKAERDRFEMADD